MSPSAVIETVKERLMALILELLFKAMGPRTVRRFNEACMDPARTQATRLDQIVKKNSVLALART